MTDALDPQVQAWLDTVPPPDPEARLLTIEELRAIPWPWGSHPDVHRVWDDAVEVGGTSIPVRVYRPSDERPLPAVVFLHGGGWVLGSIDLVDSQCRHLANDVGCVVVNVGYRLAPEHPYPTPLDDCVAALRWTAVHTEHLGVDGRRLAVVGESAGGNLAAAAALRCRDAGSPSLVQQVLLYPVLDDDFDRPSMVANERFLAREELRGYWDHYAPDPADRRSRYVAPVRATPEELAGVAPATVVTAGLDPLCDEGDAYADQLREAGVPVTHLRYPAMIHGFVAMAETFTRGAEARAAVAATLRAALST